MVFLVFVGFFHGFPGFCWVSQKKGQVFGWLVFTKKACRCTVGLQQSSASV